MEKDVNYDEVSAKNGYNVYNLIDNMCNDIYESLTSGGNCTGVVVKDNDKFILKTPVQNNKIPCCYK